MTNKMTESIIDYGNSKYGKPIGMVILAKSLAVVSLNNKNSMHPLSILNIAPSGNFKTRTSEEIKKLFSKNVVELGSDITMNSLLGRDEELEGKTLNINDLTLLLSTKRTQTKNRICSGLAELLSEGRYTYADFKHNILLQAKCNIITNITTGSFESNKHALFISNTFIERLLPIRYEVSIENQINFSKEYSKRCKIKFKDKIKLKYFKVGLLEKYDDDIINISRQLMENAKGESYVRAADKIKALIISNALLNGRKKVYDCDIEVARQIMIFTINPKSNYHKVILLHKQGKEVKEIADILNLSLKSVYEHIKSYKKMGNKGIAYER